MQEIVIDVDPVGNVTVEGKGIEGSECKALTQGIEEAIGVVTKTVKKPEFHRTRTTTRKVGA